jgi:N-carbamoylputrescine amidase
MKKIIKISIIQSSFGFSRNENLNKIEYFIKRAVTKNSNIILIPELFEWRYFCKKRNKKYFKLSTILSQNKVLFYFSNFSKKLRIVMILSFFEIFMTNYYNTSILINSNGSILNIYRKIHIPEGRGYEESFYFKSGDIEFVLSKTKFGKIGVAICWDQWFLETSKILTIKGANIVFYPSAIGNEPGNLLVNTKNAWKNAMIGSAALNCIPIIGSNRVGNEKKQYFYGESVIIDNYGQKKIKMDSKNEGFISYSFNLKLIKNYKKYFGLIKGRRPKFYKEIIK